MDSNATEQSASNYLPALNSIVTNVNTAAQQIAALYQKNHLAMTPETIICLYAYWLGYIINQKIIGNQQHLAKLILDTIQEQSERGQDFYHIVKISTEQDNGQLDQFVRTHGVIVVSILKFIQLTSDLVKQGINNKHSKISQKEQMRREQSIRDSVETIFERTYQLALQDVNNLTIPNPLIFLLEHFSVMLGWLIGFFSQLTNQSVNHLFNKSVPYITKMNQKTH